MQHNNNVLETPLSPSAPGRVGENKTKQFSNGVFDCLWSSFLLVKPEHFELYREAEAKPTEHRKNYKLSLHHMLNINSVFVAK